MSHNVTKNDLRAHLKVLAFCLILEGGVFLLGMPNAGAMEIPSDPCGDRGTRAIEKVGGQDGRERVEREALLSEVDDLLADMARFRGWSPPKPVSKEFKDKTFFRDWCRRALENVFPVSRRDGYERAMVWLGLASPDPDWMTRLSDGAAEAMRGLYDPATATFYLADWQDSGDMRETVIHELAHALQDQKFGLARRIEQARRLEEKGEDDRAMALRSVWEGDATIWSWRFLGASGKRTGGLDTDDFGVWLDRRRKMTNGMHRAWGCTSRAVQFMNFPYEEGALYMDAAWSRAGWRGVDQLWDNPPRSLRQVLAAGAVVPKVDQVLLPNLRETNPAGGACLWSQTMGERGLWAVLLDSAGESRARRTVEGWRGDRFELWRDGDGTVGMLGAIEFDEPSQAEEFQRAFAETQNRRFAPLEAFRDDGAILWVRSGRDHRMAQVECRDNRVFVVEGWSPHRATDIATALRERTVFHPQDP